MRLIFLRNFNYLCIIYIFFVNRDVIVYVIIYSLVQLNCVKLSCVKCGSFSNISMQQKF